jgi:hypothetical protein
MAIRVSGDFPVTSVGQLPTEPAMPPANRSITTEHQNLSLLVRESDGWVMPEWAPSDLALARAALRHMLSIVEREMGSRKMLMGPVRNSQ